MNIYIYINTYEFVYLWDEVVLLGCDSCPPLPPPLATYTYTYTYMYIHI